MKKLSERELNNKIESFLSRKNAEVFHSKDRELKVNINRSENFATVKYA